MEMGIQRLAELEKTSVATSHYTDTEVDSSTKLTAPQFVTEPEPQEVTEGEMTRFSARITGHPRPRCFWVINGKHLFCF